MTVDELHGVIAERLDDIKALIEKQNGRMSAVEKGLSDHKVVDAYRTGAMIGGGTILMIVWESLRRKLGW